MAIEDGLPVEGLPGTSLVTYALCQSGFPSDSFLFHGILSGVKQSRTRQLEEVRRSLRTAVILAGDA